jgi:hypothetical protein
VDLLETSQILGNLGAFVGAIAVFGSLVFLGGQIRQSNRLGQAEAERDWFMKWHDIMRSTAADTQSAALFNKGLHEYEALDKAEKAVFSGYLISILDHADVLRRLNAQGLVSDDLAQPVLQVCLGFIKTPGGDAWWNEVGPVMTIYSYIESLPREGVTPMSDLFSYYGR